MANSFVPKYEQAKQPISSTQGGTFGSFSTQGTQSNGFKSFSSTQQDLTDTQLLLELARAKGGAVETAAEDIMNPKNSIMSHIAEIGKDAFTGFVDVISTPGEIVAGMISPDKTIKEAMDENLTVDRVLFGETDPDATTLQKIGSWTGRTATNILTDPLTYLSFGTAQGIFGLKAAVEISTVSETGELITKALSPAGKQLFEKGIQQQIKGLTSTALKTAAERDLSAQLTKDLVKQTLDAELNRDFIKQSIGNLVAREPKYAELLLDKGGIKFFGQSILSGQRIGESLKFIPGWRLIDETTKPVRNAIGSLFDTAIDAEHGSSPMLSQLDIDIKAAKNLTAARTEEVTQSWVKFARAKDITPKEAENLSLAFEASKIKEPLKTLTRAELDMLGPALKEGFLPADPRLAELWIAAKGLKSKQQLKLLRGAGIAVKEIEGHFSHVLVDTPIKNVRWSMPPSSKVVAGIQRKMGDTVAEAATKGVQFEKNLITAEVKRGLQNAKVATTVEFLRGSAKKFGKIESEAPQGWRKIAVANMKNNTVDFNQFMLGKTNSESLFFHPAVAKRLENFVGAVINDEPTQKLLEAFDSAQNLWKASVTSIFPAFHGRNAISNTFLSFMDLGYHALNPIIHKQSIDFKIADAKIGKIEEELLKWNKEISTFETKRMVEVPGAVIPKTTKEIIKPIEGLGIPTNHVVDIIADKGELNVERLMSEFGEISRENEMGLNKYVLDNEEQLGTMDEAITVPEGKEDFMTGASTRKVAVAEPILVKNTVSDLKNEYRDWMGRINKRTGLPRVDVVSEKDIVDASPKFIEGLKKAIENNPEEFTSKFETNQLNLIGYNAKTGVNTSGIDNLFAPVEQVIKPIVKEAKAYERKPLAESLFNFMEEIDEEGKIIVAKRRDVRAINDMMEALNEEYGNIEDYLYERIKTGDFSNIKFVPSTKQGKLLDNAMESFNKTKGSLEDFQLALTRKEARTKETAKNANSIARGFNFMDSEDMYNSIKDIVPDTTVLTPEEIAKESVEGITKTRQPSTYKEIIEQRTRVAYKQNEEAMAKFKEAMDEVVITDKSGYEWTQGELRTIIKNNNIALSPNTRGAMDVTEAKKSLTSQLFPGEVSMKEKIGTFANPLSTNWIAYQKGFRMNQLIEEQAHLVHFFSVLKETGDVQLSVARTKQFLFDYQNLTPFEQTFLKRLIPFYTFTRKNLEGQVRNIMSTPGRASAQITAFRTLGDVIAGDNLTDEEKKVLPDWMTRGFTTLSKRDGNAAEIFSSFGTPLEQPFQTFTPNAFLGSITPILRVPMEMATGQNFFYGKPISEVTNATAFKHFPKIIKDFIGYDEIERERKDGTKFKMYISLRPERMNFVLNLPPTTRMFSIFKQLTEADQTEGSRLMELLFGTKVYSVDLEIEAKKRDAEVRAEMETLLDNDDIVATFKKTYIPKK